MTQLTLGEAENIPLRDILDEGAKGEEIVVSGDGINYKIIVTIEQTAQPAQQITGKRIPTFGSAKGRIKMADDFDETPEGFEPYMP